jgi:hypothetical protein
MAVIKTIPIQKVINGTFVNTSDISIVSEAEYSTSVEGFIIVRAIPQCRLILNSKNTDNVIVKAMTNVIVVPDSNKIDEEYDEISLEKGACVEFKHCSGTWYIISSDGLKG